MPCLFLNINIRGEKMPKVRVKLINSLVVGQPGEKFSAFGHEFEIQPDGSAVANVHSDFVDTEVKAGRYVVVDDPRQSDPDGLAIEQYEDEKSEADKFGYDLGNYFGAGDLGKLREKMAALKKNDLQKFAETRIKIILPDRMGKAKMISEIVRAIEASLNEKPKDEDK